MKGLSQSLGLLLIAAICAGLSAVVRPSAIPWSVGELEVELAVVQAWEEVLWVDARTEADYHAGTYPGAVLVNEESWESGLADLLDRWTPEQRIVVFCSSQSCLRSHEVAERLKTELGAEQVYTLKGGWESLQVAGATGGGAP